MYFKDILFSNRAIIRQIDKEMISKTSRIPPQPHPFHPHPPPKQPHQTQNHPQQQQQLQKQHHAQEQPQMSNPHAVHHAQQGYR